MKKIKTFKRFDLVFFSIFLFQISLSQENYLSGYVINNNGDTLYGFIDYRNWEINPKEIKYKTEIDEIPAAFKPTDILEFRVHNEIYVSGIVNIEISQFQASRLEKDPQIHLKVDTTFLQTLFKGAKSLYFYKNSEGREYFYIKHDTVFELLIYKRFQEWEEYTRVMTENKKYLGQLTLYLNNCPTIQKKLESTTYTQKSLINLFQYYYDCSQTDISFQKEEEKIRAEIGVLAGVSFTSFKFNSTVFIDLNNTEYSLSTDFSGGLFLNLIFPRNNRKWSLNNELLFTTYKVKGRYEEIENENYYTITSTELGYSYLKLNNLVRYKYPIGRVFLFLNVGISNGFAISETNYKMVKSKFYETEEISEGLALEDTRKYEQSYIVGSGAQYKNFSIDFRYEKGNGMSKYSALNSRTNRYYCLVGFRF